MRLECLVAVEAESHRPIAITRMYVMSHGRGGGRRGRGAGRGNERQREWHVGQCTQLDRLDHNLKIEDEMKRRVVVMNERVSSTEYGVCTVAWPAQCQIQLSDTLSRGGERRAGEMS